MSKIIVAVSGTGKTYFVKHNLNWVDFDGYYFDYLIHSKEGEKKITEYIEWCDYNIITGSRRLTRYKKLKDKIAYVILPSEEMRVEILKRVVDRDTIDLNYWASFYIQNYEKVIQDYKDLPFPKIYLKPGQYVSDVIDENGDVKEGVEVVYD